MSYSLRRDPQLNTNYSGKKSEEENSEAREERRINDSLSKQVCRSAVDVPGHTLGPGK